MLPEPPCSAGAVLNFFQSCVVFLAVRWLLDRIRLRSGNPAITLESTDFSPPVAATGGSGRWGGVSAGLAACLPPLPVHCRHFSLQGSETSHSLVIVP